MIETTETTEEKYSKGRAMKCAEHGRHGEVKYRALYDRYECSFLTEKNGRVRFVHVIEEPRA